MQMEPKTIHGNLNISDHVIATIAETVVREVKGVALMGTAPISAKTAGGSKSVVLSTEDQVAMMDIYVVVNTRRNIQRTSEEIQKKVKSMVQDMTGIAVSRVNVHIQDVAADESQKY